jgi:hypothetical protein
MKDYSKAYIYRYWNKETQYFGGSATPWIQRQRAHRTKNNNCYSRYIIQGDLPWDCEIVEYFPCKNKEELRARERFYIENNECINRNVPGRSRKEYVSTHKEDYLERTRIHRKEHPEWHREWNRQNRIKNGDKLRAQARARRKANPEKAREKNAKDNARLKKICPICNTIKSKQREHSKKTCMPRFCEAFGIIM